MEKIQNILKQEKLDAYLIYDFRGSNFIGRKLIDFTEHTTRRWVCVITQSKVSFLLPKLEEAIFNVDGEKLTYTSYEDFENKLKSMLEGINTLALDYSEENNIAVQDIVPGGFIELLRRVGPNMTLVSSANLNQYISAVWGSEGYKTHKEATKDLTEIKDLFWEFIEKSLKDSKSINDYDGRMFVINEYKKRNLITDGDICIVSTNERTGNPHYWPTEERNYPIEKNSLLLLDIWAKKDIPNSIYSDSTFMAWIGPDPVPGKIQEVWDIVKTGRDKGIEQVMNNINNDLRGYQVDRVVRDYITEKGYGDFFVHRTGHSIDTNDHGNGADMDDYEKKDIRKVLPDTGFSIEPGIYLPEFGIRAEIDMYIHSDNTPEVSTFKQDDLKVIDI